MNKLQGKVAVVTGGSSGIGKATSILFAEEGARVVVAARSVDGLNETVKIIRNIGGEALAVQADVTRSEDVQNIFHKTIETYGKLDIIFNNAGMEQPYYLIHELPEEIWFKVIDTNLNSVYLGMKYGIPHMLDRGGVIINTGSPASLTGIPYSPAYCASKAALIGLTRATAFDYGDRNIRINCLIPGATNTPLLKRAWSGPIWEKEVKARFSKKAPLERMAEPEEMAKTVLFLASDDSSIATGAAFVIDGGVTAI